MPKSSEQKPKPPCEPTIAFPLVTSLAAKLCLEISRLEILASEIADEREKYRDALDGIRAIFNGPRVDVALMLIRVESIVSALDEQHSEKGRPR